MSALTHLPTIRRVLGYLWTEHRIPNGPAAEAMMVAIGLQESRFIHRDQIVAGKPVGQVGPATGFWQFEKNGGVAGVMGHHLTADIARKVTEAAGVAWDRDAIWRSFTQPAGDQLAAAFARLLLYTDPAPLPAPTPEQEQEAFDYYLRLWRPGAWTRGTPEKRAELRAKWGRNWRAALAAIGAPVPAPAPAPAPPVAPPRPDLEARVAALEAKLERLADALGR